MTRVRSRPARLLLPLATVVLAALGLTACHGVLEITADPSLFPAFSRAAVDYVNRCDPAAPTAVTVDAPDGTTVSVDGGEPRSGDFTTEVEQAVGHRFTIEVTSDDTTTTHHVRCLPEDFPAWSVERTGDPQAEFYSAFVPATRDFFAPAYPAIFDTNGVPVWWLAEKTHPVLWNLLSNGHFATIPWDGAMREYDLAGALVRELHTVDGPVDVHDAILLPNGNYVLVTAQTEPCDLTLWGEPAESSCINHVVEELTPEGGVAWSWDTAANIPPTETTPRWRTTARDVHDPWHYNSIEFTGDGFLLSFRHLDAVYKVIQGGTADGTIAWKIGGTPRPESLVVVGDAVFTAGGGFSGQHDARWLPDDVLTLHDNGTGIRAPRALAYRIDEELATATLLEEVSDSRYPTSPCCGSTRRLPDGNWVSGWGGTNAVTEQAPDGTPVFTLTHNGGVYRGLPILPGELDLVALRAGMDTQYPK